MSVNLQLMKKLLFKYILEFIVIVFGITISFYLEKQNAILYKEDFKNESLKKLRENINQDIEDNLYNLDQHERAYQASEILINKGQELYREDNDSLGYLLVAAGQISTIFVDNSEEYNALRNSGLIELIDNDLLVSSLQKKYSRHIFLKEFERLILNQSSKMNNLIAEKIEISNKTRLKGQPVYWSPFKSNEPFLSDKELNLFFYKGILHGDYSNMIKRSIAADSVILLKIEKEISQ